MFNMNFNSLIHSPGDSDAECYADAALPELSQTPTMLEAPDKRVWYFFVPVFFVGMIFLLAEPDSTLGRIVEPILYFFAVILGVGLATLSIRDGYSSLHLSHSMDEAPVLFWLDVGVGCILFSAVGAWKLFHVATSTV